MRNLSRQVWCCLVLAAAWFALPAPAGTVMDSFNVNVNYLTNGVAGTIWDGVYFGAGEFQNTGLGGGGAGATLQCDANLTAAGTLTLRTTGTAWEGVNDDGFFLYKVVPGDFSMSVRVVSPFNNSPYNTAGLQARAFSIGGDPLGGSEDFVSWTRFDQYNYANYLRNEVNGTVTPINPGGYPNSNYWLRMDRVNGTNFYFYQKASSGAAWTPVSFPAPVNGTRLGRADLAGLPLQVGLIHATFGSERGVQFSDFTLSISNVNAVAEPGAAAAVTAHTNLNGSVTLSWTPGTGSSGSTVVLWKGTNVLKQAPANGFTYSSDPVYGLGDTLPAKDYFVVHSGPETNVTVNGLEVGTTYHAAVFAHAGAGNSRTYTPNAARASFTAVPGSSGPLLIQAQANEGDLYLTAFNTAAGRWYQVQFTESLAAPQWQPLDPVAQLATGDSLAVMQSGGVMAGHRFYRIEQFALPPAGANLAFEASTGASYVSPWENLNAINDGYDPANSSDHSQGAYGNWPQTGTQWVEYEWPLAVTVSMTDVYWWNDGGGIRAPSACRFKYWDGANYVPVQNASGVGVELNRFNTTTFLPITTTRLRLEFDAGSASTGILEWRVYDAGRSPTNWPGAPANSQFAVRANSGALTSLKYRNDAYPTEYLGGGSRLGDVSIRYRQTGTNWIAVQTAALSSTGQGSYGWAADSSRYTANYRITNNATPTLALESAFSFATDDVILWTLRITNLTASSLEVGDLALPLRMNTTFAGPSSSVFKHSFISGHGSFLFWMRPNSVGPFLTLTTGAGTALEYWDALDGGYEAYVHSLAAGAAAAAQGTQWRQPHTSLVLAPGGSQAYQLKFHWAADYDGVRQVLVDEGDMDIHVVPGMTVPTKLFARVALRTTQPIHSIAAEFPAATQIEAVGTSGDYQLYDVTFSKLGENRLTVNHGANEHTYLEFFVTEPLETLIQKRGAFIAAHQIDDATKWYDGLLCEWNMSSGVQLTPDNYDLITGWRIYAVTCDDPGLSKPAYLAAKNALFPVQDEVTAMDDYLEKFVWGGLQRTTSETYPYGVYGIPDWYQNRNSSNTGSGGQLHIWRIYDYPHVMLMYFSMYQVAARYPHIATALTAQEYLERAYGTAVGLFTIPLTVTGWSAYQTGLMNERVIVDLMAALEANGLAAEAQTLRDHWEQKVRYFVNNPNSDLFGSEYAFDSTGFETTHELAKYALQIADQPGETNSGIPVTNAVRFLEKQLAANILCRGWLEAAYYFLGSDYRATAGDEYVLTYMSQMGGWGVLDYGLHYATNASPYLRLGYASYLSAWALMNTGTPESNYGFWFPGPAHDGGAGGGFEAAPYGTTWLGQPHHRGSWYYASEIDLGYCGALRMAATVLADDPIFGRFCYGGTWTNTGTAVEVVSLDGVRQRFHALLNGGSLHLTLRNDQFAADQPIVLNEDFSAMSFAVLTLNNLAHSAVLQLSVSVPGTYAVSHAGGVVATLDLEAGEEVEVELPLDDGTTYRNFQITR